MRTENHMTGRYDAVIIGAGLGGLATASLMAQRGQKVIVIDRHNVPGGYATNFRRQDFTFDVSLHSFDGMVDGADSFECIKACGVADKIEFLPHKKLYRYRSGDIDVSVRERDLPLYQAQLAALFPEEKENIARLFAEAERTYANVAGFLYSKLPFWLRLMATPFLFHRILRYENDTVHRFFSRYTKNERLKSVLAAQWTYYGLPPDRLAFPYFCYPFVDYLKNGGYSIKGGSQKLSDALREVIEAHGGKVILSSPVTEIHLGDDKRVCGVTSRKTGRIDTGTVIANISPYAVTDLVGKRHFPVKFLDQLGKCTVSTSGFQVYLGLDCTLEQLGVAKDEYVMFMSDNPDLSAQHREMMAGRLDGNATGWSLNFFSNVDPSLAPKGKSTLGIFSLLGNDDEWQDLPKADYKQKKQELTDLLIRKAEQVLPGLSAHIEVCEAGSPRTLTKFTSNPEGAIYGFEQTTRQAGLFRRFRQRYPIGGLYHVGAWTFPGAGFIGTLLSARVLVDRYFGGTRRPRPRRADTGQAVPAQVEAGQLAP
jgi:prolycopene isomerase